MSTHRGPTLIKDEHAGMIERRRGDCLRLRACEVEWIAAHGGEQAKCPSWCRHHVAAESAGKEQRR